MRKTHRRAICQPYIALATRPPPALSDLPMPNSAPIVVVLVVVVVVVVVVVLVEVVVLVVVMVVGV